MDIDQGFKQSAELVKTLKKTPSDEEKLKLYGLFKQVTVGNINIDKPWAVQFEASAKWDAWNKVKSLDKDTASLKYIGLVTELVDKYGI